MADSQDYCRTIRASLSTAAGDDALPTPPATPPGERARKCLLDEFRRLEVEVAAKKLRIGPQRSAAMKRYWALRKARDLRANRMSDRTPSPPDNSSSSTVASNRAIELEPVA